MITLAESLAREALRSDVRVRAMALGISNSRDETIEERLIEKLWYCISMAKRFFTHIIEFDKYEVAFDEEGYYCVVYSFKDDTAERKLVIDVSRSVERIAEDIGIIINIEYEREFLD